MCESIGIKYTILGNYWQLVELLICVREWGADAFSSLLPLNHKRTESSLAPPIFYVAKNSAIKR